MVSSQTGILAKQLENLFDPKAGMYVRKNVVAYMIMDIVLSQINFVPLLHCENA